MNVKMLIVDDAQIICKGLQLHVPWETVDVEVAGIANDGDEAIRFFEDGDADIVLTDICMPEKDGLALAEWLRREKPGTRIVILSGYDEFEYARRAMRLGIEDFLLKPVDVDELLALVGSIAGQIREERDDERVRRKETGEKWLSSMMRSSDGEEAEDYSTPESIAKGRPYRIVALQFEDYYRLSAEISDEERRELRLHLKQYAEQSFESNGIDAVACSPHPNLLLAFCAGKRVDDEAYFMRFCEEIVRGWEGLGSLAMSVSTASVSVKEAGRICGEALTAIQNRLSLPHAQIGSFEALRERRSIPLRFVEDETEKRLTDALYRNDQDAMDNLLTGMVDKLQAEGHLLRETLLIYEELRMRIYRKLQSAGMKEQPLEDVLDLSQVDFHIYNGYGGVAQLIRQDLGRLAEHMRQSEAGKHFWIIERAKKYVVERGFSDVKASEIAAALKITPNYFSNIFKQNAGKSFPEFVNELRVEQAKQLLAGTTDRVFEISDQVGYKEYKYFVSIFKGHTGLTPTEYRKRTSGGTQADTSDEDG